jgi:hypothetical protein
MKNVQKGDTERTQQTDHQYWLSGTGLMDRPIFCIALICPYRKSGDIKEGLRDE